MGNSAGKIALNVGYLGLRFVQSLVSVASAIATGGLTAPIAAASIATTSLSIRDFINDPSGDPNRTTKGVIKDVANFIGGNSTKHVVNIINKVASSSDAVPFGELVPSGNLENEHRLAKSVITQVARTTAPGQIAMSSIAALSNPQIRALRSVSNNNRSRLLLNVIENSMNAAQARLPIQQV